MLPKLWPCDLQCYLGTAKDMPLALDLCIMLLKEPWAVREFMKALGATSPASEAQPLARQIASAAAEMCKNLPSPIQELDPRVALERASISRQFGLLHIGFLSTLRRFAILIKMDQLPAKRKKVKRASENEQFLLYEGEAYVVQQDPHELQEFVEKVQRFDASMGTLPAVSSVSYFHKYCLAMASRMPEWFGGSDAMLRYVVPHYVRKFWLRVEGLCDRGVWCTTTVGRTFTPAGLTRKAFTKFFEKLSLKELLELCPDSGEYMKCLPDAYPIQVLKPAFPGVHPLMVSLWACLLHDATSTLGAKHCMCIAKKRHCSLLQALNKLLINRGDELPPNLFELFSNIT